MKVLLPAVFVLIILFSHSLKAYAGQQMPDTTRHGNESMSNDEGYVPPVDALTPYESAIASFQRKLPEDEPLAFVISIMSPAESYAIMIQRELESKPEYGITVTLSPEHNRQTREVEAWRVHGISKPLRFGDLSEQEHHAIAGWAFQVAAYFQSTLQNFAYRL